MDLSLLERNCPNCSAKTNAATPMGHQESPDPGDLCMCYACGAFLQFDETLKLIQLSEEQFAALPQATRLMLENMRAVHDRM